MGLFRMHIAIIRHEKIHIMHMADARHIIIVATLRLRVMTLPLSQIILITLNLYEF